MQSQAKKFHFLAKAMRATEGFLKAKLSMSNTKCLQRESTWHSGTQINQKGQEQEVKGRTESQQ